MPACTKCHEQIDSLEYNALEWDWGVFYGDGEWNVKGPGDIEKISFSCPKCGKVLFRTVKNADRFLTQAGGEANA